MASGIYLLLTKDSKGYDVSELVTELKWSGRKGSAARTLEATLVDDPSKDRAPVDVTRGTQCIFKLDGTELFRGIVMTQKHSNNKTMTIKAFDNGVYLANNKDTFNYTNKDLAYIFKDICKRFGLPYSECSASSHKIPEIAKSKSTAYDALCEAMSYVYNHTGQRHYVDSDKGKLRLRKRSENITQWVLENGANIITYNYSVSIEKVRTRVKFLAKEDKVAAEKKNASLEKLIGIMQDVETAKDDYNSAQLNNLANGTLKEKSTPQRTLKIEALGIPSVVSGVGVFIVIPDLGVSKTYYVEQDTHTISGGQHKMTVSLVLANDTEYDKDYTVKK